MDTTEIYSSYGSMVKETNGTNGTDKSDEIAQEEYDDLILPYQEALAILNVRLTALREEYKSQSRNYPIHSIQQRIKTKKSISKKTSDERTGHLS